VLCADAPKWFGEQGKAIADASQCGMNVDVLVSGAGVATSTSIRAQLVVNAAGVHAQSVAVSIEGIDARRIEPAYCSVHPKLAGRGMADADFCIECDSRPMPPRWIAFYGIESPGLTAALALARFVAQ